MTVRVLVVALGLVGAPERGWAQDVAVGSRVHLVSQETPGQAPIGNVVALEPDVVVVVGEHDSNRVRLPVVPSTSIAEEIDLLGKRVRLQTGSSTPLVGVVTNADSDSLLLQTSKQGGAFRVSREDILALEVSRGVRRQTVLGLIGGALAWATVVGIYAAFDTLDESGVGEPLFIGGMVAVGGIVGSQFAAERWEQVPVSAVSVRVVPRRRGAQAEVVLRF
jgi:hypothetical protein